MVTNFDFLRKIDRNVFEIISDAELLYRDEYFEQSMAQTRRFAEVVCKNVLGDSRTTETTFDQMLATLKDKNKGSIQENEFIEDLYFLKKCGNKAVHSLTTKKDGVNALECLQRAFEVAINYSVYNLKADKDILNLHFDIKLLATGKRDKSLAKKYENGEKQLKALKENSKTKKTSKTTSKKTPKKQTKQVSKAKSYPPKKNLPIFWITVGIFMIVSLIVMVYVLMSL